MIYVYKVVSLSSLLLLVFVFSSSDIFVYVVIISYIKYNISRYKTYKKKKYVIQ